MKVQVQAGLQVKEIEVPALFTIGVWAVTPSQYPSAPGFVVTHQPSGRCAWAADPLFSRHPATAGSLANAIKAAREIAAVATHPGWETSDLRDVPQDEVSRVYEVTRAFSG